MKNFARNGLLIAILLSACAPAAATPTIQPTAAATQPLNIVSLQESPILCNSEIPEAVDAYEQASSLADAGKLAEAEAAYRQAIALDPGFCDAMDNLGVMLRRQGRVEEAIELYQQSLEVLPSNELALQNLALAYSILGENDKSRAEYEKLIAIAPLNPEGYYGLGTLQAGMGQYADAIEQFKTAAELYQTSNSPYLPDALYNIGYSNFMLDDCVAATEFLEMAYPNMREDAGINYILGVCYLTEPPGDAEKARPYLLKAQELGVELEDALKDAAGIP